MSGFISRAACHGRRPAQYVAHIARERSSLLAQLLKERDTPRFVVAPDGYGKTFLAIEYAETMFAWVHTFWVNAKSPCFIRDLDAGTIASSCFSVDAEAALAVFDDVPPLDPVRAEAFSREIDLLLAGGCEVIVTCVPTCDMAGSLQPDRIRLNARDLLLDDIELEQVRSADRPSHGPVELAGSAERIPVLAWAIDDSAPYAFAKAALYEEMPSDLLLVTGSVLMLQRGSFSDLLAFCPVDKEIVAEVLGDYPHLGFDSDIDRFGAPPVSIEALAVPLKNRLAELVARSSCDTVEQLVHAWAKALVDAGQAGRACDVVREICPRRKRAAWLIENAHALVGQACFFPALRLARDQDSCKGAARARLAAIEALCRFILGDEQGALRCAKRHAFDASAPFDVRVCSLLVTARLARGALSDKIREALHSEVEVASADAAHHPVDWALLAEAWCVSDQGPEALASLWDDYRKARVGDDVLCICASWLFSLLNTDEDAAGMLVSHRSVEQYVRRRLQVGAGRPPDFFAASAGLAMEEAHGRGVRYESGVLETSVLICLRQVEMGILSQRRAFEEGERVARARRGDWASTHPDMLLTQQEESLASRSRRSVPILTLHLFGRFEALIGDMPVDPKRFNRQNSRTLLVLLAVNQGREMSRETLAHSMWPRSTEEVARKNFYTVWSNLRRALTLPDGTCPYLVRHQFGCSLEPRYVQSDVERLSEICRELLFGLPNIEQWSLLFAEIDRDFSSDLMPAERKNRLVLQARNEYRTRLVDALVAATDSVVDTDNPQWGIWFARAALVHDETREDAYVALMRAQIAGNQRTAAMMTYLKCRRALSDQLGIDPSPETTLLYESLLDSA